MTDETVTTTEVVEKKPTHTVLDNSDLAAVLADARGEPRPEKTDDKPAEKVVSVKEVGKEIEPEEDEDGLTAEDRKELTEKMKKAIGKKHRAFKDAQEFGQGQFAEKQAAMREADKLRRENERLKEQLTPKAEEAKEPDRANFKTDAEYNSAVIDYRVDQRLKAKAEADHAKALEDHQREIVEQATARIETAKETGPADFQEVLESSNEMDIPVNVAGYMQESEMFAELAYHLAKNPDVLENLTKLPPVKQLVAIGKIESTLKPFSDKTEKVTTAKAESEDGKAKADPSTNAKPASKARPEPIKPLDTGSTSQVEKDPSELTYEETFSRFQKMHKVNLKARQRH